MYYEIYIDQFFLEHLLIGYLLIVVSVSLQRDKLSWKRIAAGSVTDAVLMTAFVCAGVPQLYFLAMPAAGAVVYLGKTGRETGRGLLFLLFVTVCFGGTLEALMELVKLPLMIGVVVSVLALRCAGKWLERRRLKLAGIVTVKLQWENQLVALKGMVDTGNRLTEPLTGCPVSIVDGGSVKTLLGDGWEERRGFYLIPYHSIGKDKGWMKGVTIDCLEAETREGTVVIHGPVLAIYEGQVSAEGQYQVILHPMHAETR